MVAEGALLGGAATSAGDVVPPRWQILVRPPRKRVAVNDGSPRQGREIHSISRRGCQGYGRHPHAWQVVAGAVVFRLGQALCHLVYVLWSVHAAPQARSRTTAALWPPTPRLAQRAASRSGASRGSSTM